MEAPFKAVALAMQIEKVSNNCCTPIQFKYLWQQSFRSLYITTILLASISHYLLDSGIVQQLFCVLKGKYMSNLLLNSLSAFPQLCSYKRSCQRCFAFQALYKFCRVLNAERNLSLNLKYIYIRLGMQNDATIFRYVHIVYFTSKSFLLLISIGYYQNYFYIVGHKNS